MRRIIFIVCMGIVCLGLAGAASARTDSRARPMYTINTCDAYADAPFVSNGILLGHISMMCGNGGWNWIELMGSLQKYTNSGWVTVQQKDARKDKPTGTGMSLTFTANCPILGYWYRTQAKAWWSTYPNPSSSPWVTSSEAFIYC